MKVRGFLRVVAAIAIIILPTSSLTSATGAQNSVWPTKPSIGFTSSEAKSGSVRSVSWISGYSYAEGATSGLFTRSEECAAINDEKCKNADSIAINAILPPCVNGVSDNCVETLALSNGASQFVTAELKSEVKSAKFEADKTFGTPYGGAISVWKVNGFKHSLGVEDYAVKVHIDLQNFNNKNCNSDIQKCPFRLGNFSASVSPIQVVPANPAFNCLWKNESECGQIGEFADGTRVSLKIRITNNLTGFLFGRMKNVAIEVTPFSSSVNSVRVEADPIDVPSIYAFVEKSALSQNPEIEKYWMSRRANLASQDLASQETIDLGPWPQYAMEDFLAFEKFVKSGPTVKSIWKFGNGLGIGDGSSCFADKTKLLGLVSTNAPTYAPNPPSFDGSSLNYKVGGAHHLEDGQTLMRGVYDLALRTEFARCLYGFSNAPIKASISVTSSDGDMQNVATEVLRQDKAKEWIYLSAKNFTFSAPTIRIKLSQDAVAVNQAPKRTTITCFKGKLVKKVTGTKPVCPAGYKKR